MLKLDNITLSALAPPSITHDKNVKAIFDAVDPELRASYQDIQKVLIYSRIDELPENILDLLAWQWHVDFYELANDIQAKREMVKGSIEWHRHKGTAYAIVKALEMLGIEAKFIPWYEEIITEPENIHDLSEFPPLQGIDCLLTETVTSKGEPYTFSLDAKLNDTFFQRVDWNKPTQAIRQAVVESKATRSYASKIFVHFEDYLQNELVIKQVTPQAFFRRVNINQATGRALTHFINADNHTQTAISLTMDIDKHDYNELLEHRLAINKKSILGKLSRPVINAHDDKQTLTHEINLTGTLTAGKILAQTQKDSKQVLAHEISLTGTPATGKILASGQKNLLQQTQQNLTTSKLLTGGVIIGE